MLSVDHTERSRRYHSLVLQRMASIGQRTVAEQIGISEATVSRFVASEMERLCQALAIVGLKVVPVEMKCYPASKMEAILTLAKSGMDQIGSINDLSWED